MASPGGGLPTWDDEDGHPFPIVEAFGYAAHSATPNAKDALKRRHCRFSNTLCEKFRQYRFGYCSVTYAAADDSGIRRTYAVCDHRLDGDPLELVLRQHFGSRRAKAVLVPEVVLTNPRMSFDYVAILPSTSGDTEEAIVIETQAIDIRGGGVGPAWAAWFEGKPEKWRSYFTDEAEKKGRKDNVAYGVNMANIFKRLGIQAAVKGTFLSGISVPLYIVMQNLPFEYLRRRIRFTEAPGRSDINFVTFDYTGRQLPDGTLEFSHVATIGTTISDYVAAMTGASSSDRDDFLDRVKRKAGLA